MLDLLGGRKFIGFFIIVFLFFILTVLKLLPVESFVTFVTANFGIYVVGNVGDAFASKNNTTPTVPPVG
jgi:hypothetical protein